MKLTNDELLMVAAMYIGAPISFFNPVTKEWGKCRKLTPSGLALVGNGLTEWNLNLIPLDKIPDMGAKKIFDELSFIKAQYLISKGYAIPLWFGFGHWANGRTAIELEIAIDPTKEVQPS